QIPFPDTNFIKRLLENSRKSKLSRKTKKNDPPRPPNAFFLFRNSVHFYLSSLNLKVPQISTTSGKLWFEATEETKTKYSKLQSIAKILHLEMYPGYVYRPRKNLHIIVAALGALDSLDAHNVLVDDDESGNDELSFIFF
ncbi:20024_t:CDS:2, partial [Entrophospora sp. SA101]